MKSSTNSHIRKLKQAIRLKCTDCLGGNRASIPECCITRCALYPFRTGHVNDNLKYNKKTGRWENERINC